MPHPPYPEEDEEGDGEGEAGSEPLPPELTFYGRLELVGRQLREIADTGSFVRLKGAINAISFLLVEAGRTGMPATELQPVVEAAAQLREFVMDVFDEGNLDDLLSPELPAVREVRHDLLRLWAMLPLASAAHLAGMPDTFKTLIDRSLVDHRRRGPGAAVERAARAALHGHWEKVKALVSPVQADPELEGEDFETVLLCQGLSAVADGNLTRAEAALMGFQSSPSPEAVTHAALLHALASLRGLDLPRPEGLLPS